MKEVTVKRVGQLTKEALERIRKTLTGFKIENNIEVMFVTLSSSIEEIDGVKKHVKYFRLVNVEKSKISKGNKLERFNPKTMDVLLERKVFMHHAPKREIRELEIFKEEVEKKIRMKL